MFDLSWTECLLVAALAIIVVGPRDLPGLARTIGGIVQKGRRVYRDAASSIHRLEREMDVASRPADNGQSNDFGLLPEEVRAAMNMESPHRNAERHRQADGAYQKAVADIKAGQHETAAADSTPAPGNSVESPREH